MRKECASCWSLSCICINMHGSENVMYRVIDKFITKYQILKKNATKLYEGNFTINKKQMVSLALFPHSLLPCFNTYCPIL